ncbi:MAG TPA: DUF4232 domain-containing protein [Jatrophihabitans sp.]|nr:DUF4232 domain-containing protein [Jatrophihabitans sp.]
MNATDDDLERIIRAELAADAAAAPAGWLTRQAVLATVASSAEQNPADHPLRRWAVPLLAAVLLAAVTAGSLLVPRALTSRSAPMQAATVGNRPASRAPGSAGGKFPFYYASHTATGTCLSAQLGGKSSAPTAHGSLQAWVLHVAAPQDRSCTLSGYPDVKVFASPSGDRPGGAPLLTAAQTLHGPLGGVTGSTVPQLTLRPGSWISALVEWSSVPAKGASCVQGAPTFVLGRGWTDPPAGPICDLQVHPFVAGDTGSN